MRPRAHNVYADAPYTPDVSDRQQRRALAWLGMLPAMLVSFARASLQGYSLQPLYLVVPAAGGSVFGVLACTLATQLQQQAGREVGVEDHPAANGMATGEAIVRAPSDGHMLLLQQTTFVAQPAPEPVSYDPLRDPQPVAMVATLPLFLAIDMRLPIYSVTDLLAQAGDKSVTVNYGSNIIGTWSHLVAKQFMHDYAFHASHVAVRSETGLMQQILIGRMTVHFTCYPSVAAATANGQLRLLGVTGGTRSRFAPTVPTLCEDGLTGFNRSTQTGSFMPACASRSFSMHVVAELRCTVASGDICTTLRVGGFEPEWDAPDAFARTVRHDITHWQGVVRRAGLWLDSDE